MATFSSPTHGGSFNGDITCTLPANIPAGATIFAHASGLRQPTTPSGWTSLGEVNESTGSAWYSEVVYKVSDGTEGGTSISFGAPGGSGTVRVSAFYVTGLHATAPIDTDSELANAASTTVTGATITPTTSVGGYILMFVAATENPTCSGYTIATSPVPTFTELYDAATSTDEMQAMAYAARDSVNATGAATATLSASKKNAMHLVSMRPTGIAVSTTVIGKTKTTPAIALTISQTFVATVIAITKTVAAVVAAVNERPKWSSQDKSATSTFDNQDKF